MFGDYMNTLKLEVFSNNKLIELFKDIPYEQKQEFIYFTINDTKYIFYKDLLTFSYITKEEKVKMNFKTNTVTITLLQNYYTLDIKVNRFEYEITKNTYKITYVLESEPDVTKTILITLS